MTDRATDDAQLRTLLARAVPDGAPTLDAHALARAARTARTRRRTAGAVAGVVAVGVIVASVGLGGGEDRTARDGVAAAATAPYDAPECPATLPELADAATDLGSLEGTTSVRLCPELPDGTASNLEALVTDLEGFADRVRGTADFDPARCATISVLNTRQSLQVTYEDGTTALVPTALCSPMTAAGHTLDGGDLATAFLDALAEQRDSVAYGRETAAPTSCIDVGASSPARPGHEVVVAALACRPGGIPTPLDRAQVAALQAAWADPGTIADDNSDDSDTSGPDCTSSEEMPAQILLTTDHGDLVRLTESMCGFLVWDGWTPGQQAAIPTTLADLGVTA